MQSTARKKSFHFLIRLFSFATCLKTDPFSATTAKFLLHACFAKINISLLNTIHISI
ncbi:hypothetical protein HMPREF0971_02249 [Segatella oris F0302]|uniref:Uncharacterized protein n=1 Tax=Segatella oris F0302 TaxID=649760 RepID=D1QTC1_9BACT|nr:hypothetical protein HMPREF0971_02249 [Segatella oris F0302]